MHHFKTEPMEKSKKRIEPDKPEKRLGKSLIPLALELYKSENGATFSQCRKYRYALWRIWDKSKPTVMFIGLNPSTANEYNNDPTIRRVIRFAFEWGYGGVYMVNLFAFVTPYPEDLLNCKDPIRDNDFWLKEIGGRCDKIVFAWGSFAEAKDRAPKVIQMFHGCALVINKDGSPRHPLYVTSQVVPIQFSK